jgi:putative transposase
MHTVQRAYKYRFYPTSDQEQQLARTFGCCRFVYNHFLRVRTDGFFRDHERRGYNDTARLLTELKQQPETLWLQEVSNVCLQQALRNLDVAFRNFFQGRAHYPTFKKKRQRQSARYMSNGFSYRPARHLAGGGQIKLAKQDAPLAIRWSRPLPLGAVPSSVTVSKDTANRYFISFLVEEAIAVLPVVNRMSGLDLGLTHAVITSHGQKFNHQRYLRQQQKRLKRAQQALSRKQKGSANRDKARLKVAKIHARIADQRTDYNHKLTSQLIHENQVLAAESLAVKNLLKNHGLAQAISDVGWSQILSMLEYKALWYGRTFVQIDRFYPSSKRCSSPGCGYILESLDLSIRSWDCPACGAHHDRDINAACNALDAGLAILAGADKLRLHETTTQGHRES